MFIVSWQDGAGMQQKGHATERDAEYHAAMLLKMSRAKHAVVWELPDPEGR
jgi:hypothetical protein